MTKLTPHGLALIKRWEGCKLSSYLCPAGVWTIGYGTTTAAGLGPIRKGMVITQKQAEEWLIRSLAQYETAVSKALTRPANPQQYSAMVSLCYNIGIGAFAKSSVVKHFNAANIDGTANAFLLWNKATVKGKRIVLEGLKSRREDEKRLFLTPYRDNQEDKPEHILGPSTVPQVSTPPATKKSPTNIWGLILMVVNLIFRR